jgi:hypothetical protein
LFSLVLAIPENPMQNISSNDLPSAVNQPALVSAAINRVVDIAPAPLLPGEKQADYAEVAVRIVRVAKPRDAIEEFLVRDAVDLTWEILRLRRMKSGILKSSTGRGLRRILDEIGHPWDERDELREAFAAGDVQARKNVDAILKKAGLTMDEVAAQTLDSNLDSFERLDRMLASAEARRNNALREVDGHRDALGAGVRRSIEEIEDAEFQDVEIGEAAAGAEP